MSGATDKVLPYSKLLKFVSSDFRNLRFRLIDAKDHHLSYVAKRAATILQGLDKPIYHGSKDNGDIVIIVNAKHVQLDGDRWEEELIRYHSGYGGGFKEIPLIEMWKKSPEIVVKRAVRGELPRNVLRTLRLHKLKIFPEAEHPFSSNLRVVREDLGLTREQIWEQEYLPAGFEYFPLRKGSAYYVLRNSKEQGHWTVPPSAGFAAGGGINTAAAGQTVTAAPTKPK